MKNVKLEKCLNFLEKRKFLKILNSYKIMFCEKFHFTYLFKKNKRFFKYLIFLIWDFVIL